MKLLQEFKAFAVKGNVVDLAIGVVVGGAFGKIVTSLVSDILMPLLGGVIGAIDFKQLAWIIVPAQGEQVEVVVRYGMFLQTIIDFIIITGSIFLAVKVLSRFRKKEEKAETPAKPSAEALLLTEIRDLLKK